MVAVFAAFLVAIFAVFYFTAYTLADKDCIPGFGSISREQLYSLFVKEGKSNAVIAELYGVSESTVARKRKKYGINLASIGIYALVNDKDFNLRLKKELWNENNIHYIAKALAELTFRSGPIEVYHSEGKLTDNEMMALNKYFVNNLNWFLKLLFEDKWVCLGGLLSYYSDLASTWDMPDEIEPISFDDIISLIQLETANFFKT